MDKSINKILDDQSISDFKPCLGNDDLFGYIKDGKFCLISEEYGDMNYMLERNCNLIENHKESYNILSLFTNTDYENKNVPVFITDKNRNIIGDEYTTGCYNARGGTAFVGTSYIRIETNKVPIVFTSDFFYYDHGKILPSNYCIFNGEYLPDTIYLCSINRYIHVLAELDKFHERIKEYILINTYNLEKSSIWHKSSNHELLIWIRNNNFVIVQNNKIIYDDGVEKDIYRISLSRENVFFYDGNLIIKDGYHFLTIDKSLIIRQSEVSRDDRFLLFAKGFMIYSRWKKYGDEYIAYDLNGEEVGISSSESHYMVVCTSSKPVRKGVLDINSRSFSVPQLFSDIDFYEEDDNCSCIVTIENGNTAPLYGLYLNNKLVAPIDYTKFTRARFSYIIREPHSLYYQDGTHITDEFFYVSTIQVKLPEYYPDLKGWIKIYIEENLFKLCKGKEIHSIEHPLLTYAEDECCNDADSFLFSDEQVYESYENHDYWGVLTTKNGYKGIVSFNNNSWVIPPECSQIDVYGRLCGKKIYLVNEHAVYSENHNLIYQGSYLRNALLDSSFRICVFMQSYEDYSTTYVLIDIYQEIFQIFHSTEIKWENCIYEYDSQRNKLVTKVVECLGDIGYGYSDYYENSIYEDDDDDL
jgi:hypothetical protein